MKLLQKGTQITWTVDNLLKEGFIKVGSKTYEEYWKHTKTDEILTLSVVDDVAKTEQKYSDCDKVYEYELNSRKRDEDGTLTRVDILLECFKAEGGSYWEIAEQLTNSAVELLILAKELRFKDNED